MQLGFLDEPADFAFLGTRLRGVGNENGEPSDPIIPPGDSNLDGQVDANDIIVTLAGGKYETGDPATWAAGDWNGAPNPAFTISAGTPPPGDGLFDSNDVIVALGPGLYETGLYTASSGSTTEVNNVPEPSTFVLAALSFIALLAFGWRRRNVRA